mgnify:CR=1 FL=1
MSPSNIRRAWRGTGTPPPFIRGPIRPDISLLTIIPVLIGLIAFVAGSKYGFGGGYKSEYGYQVNPYAQGTILILILGSVFIGLATSIQEIIKENAIRPEAVIMLTDGYVGEWGNEWENPLLWVIVRNNTTYAPVGKTIHIKE